jgi:hypothetical protein
MTKTERAAQIWSLLSLCAGQRQTLSYDLLANLIGVVRPGLGQLLESIQSFCILHESPPLTSLVVSADNGLPGDGFGSVKVVAKGRPAMRTCDRGREYG